MARTMWRRWRSESGRSINKLDDCLLIEILRRLPDAKLAIQCRLVCKHWNSLTSTPYFISSFIDYHSASRKQQKPFVITAIRPTGRIPTVLQYRFFPNSSIFKVLDYDSSISHSTPDVLILATYNELLLCGCRGADENRYYIRNSVTRHHVALPLCPRVDPVARYVSRVIGFLVRCQSFRVMRILISNRLISNRHDRFPDFIVQIFSSEENQWTERKLPHPSHTGECARVITPSALAWNGLLCWLNDDNTLVFCNPYKRDAENFHIIGTPENLRHGDLLQQGLGVFQGTLRLWDQWQGLDNSQNYLSVWELKDYNTGEWSLKHEVWMEPVFVNCCFLNIQVAFDPDDEDVAYFVYKRSLVSFNMRSRAFKRVKTILQTSINRPRVFYHNLWFFMLVMPWWPTPVPTLPQNASAPS